MANLIKKVEKTSREANLKPSFSAVNGKAPKFGVNFSERGNTLNLRITYQGKKYTRSLGINIRPGTLNNKNQSIVHDEGNTALIQSIYSEINETVSKLRLLNKPINPNEILDNVLTGKGIIDGKPSFQQMLELAYNEAIEKFENGEIVEKSFRRYKTLHRDVSEYFEGLFNNQSIPLEIIAFYDVSKMIDHFRIEKKFQPETIRKRLEFGQRAYEIARQKKLHEHNPFQGHKLQKAKNYAHNHLSEKELVDFRGLELKTPTYSEIRDFFVFQCYTGLNYADLAALKLENIKESERGLSIVSKRAKTQTEVNIPLLPFALEILNQYKGSHPSKCFQIPTNQHYNRLLKELSELSGLGMNLTSSFARKTFMNLMYDKGMDESTLGLIVGHKAAKTARKYYLVKQQPNRAFDAIETVKAKLK